MALNSAAQAALPSRGLNACAQRATISFIRMGAADRPHGALDAIRALANGTVNGSEDPLKAANAIYWATWNAGAWQSDDESSNLLANVGAEFIQLADELEKYQDDPRARQNGKR